MRSCGVRSLRALALLGAWISAHACDSSAHDGSAAEAGSAGDAGANASRPFRLASAGTQLLVSGPNLGLQITPANLQEDVDLVSVHQEFYGLPWEAFSASAAPPAAWSRKMKELASSAQAVSADVFLSLSMLNGARESLAARTVIDGTQIKSEDNWSARCYDFASAPDGAEKRAAYVRYVEYMVDLFAPRYLNFAIELNLFLEKCPQSAASVIDVANAAYAAAKAKVPGLIAFPSFQIDHLYGYADDSCPTGMDRNTCFDRNYAQIEPLERDRFAISSYPYLSGIQNVADLPEDWFERGPRRSGERALIAETGWLSSDLVALHGTSQCLTVISSNEQAAAAYLERALSDATRLPLEVVTWWSNHDLMPRDVMTSCPCTYDATWCAVIDTFRNAGARLPEGAFMGEVLLKAFGVMGIRDYEGKAKPRLMSVWQAARAGDRALRRCSLDSASAKCSGPWSTRWTD
jgi:hypothetical protein